MEDHELPAAMNLLTINDNASAAMVATTSAPAPAGFNQGTIQQRLQVLIEGAKANWTYVIFWSVLEEISGAGGVLGWGDGYYKGGEDQEKSSSPPPFDQEHRKKVLRELNSLISGGSAPADDAGDEDVTDTEWFFLVSMSQSFYCGSGLVGKAFSTAQPVWVSGSDQLSGSDCERAKQGEDLGLQTIACFPCANGVVELGSTEQIQQNSDLMHDVQLLSIQLGDP